MWMLVCVAPQLHKAECHQQWIWDGGAQAVVCHPIETSGDWVLTKVLLCRNEEYSLIFAELNMFMLACKLRLFNTQTKKQGSLVTGASCLSLGSCVIMKRAFTQNAVRQNTNVPCFGSLRKMQSTVVIIYLPFHWHDAK